MYCNCVQRIPIPTKDKNGELMVYETVCKKCFRKHRTSPMSLEEYKEFYDVNNN